MAITNQERAGKAMELLRAGLAPFVEREIQSAVKTGNVRMDFKGEGIDRDETPLPSLQALEMDAGASRKRASISMDWSGWIARCAMDIAWFLPRTWPPFDRGWSGLPTSVPERRAQRCPVMCWRRWMERFGCRRRSRPVRRRPLP